MINKKKIAFLTIGDISQIATMKRALGMANPLHELGWQVSIIVMDSTENRNRIALECSQDIHIEYYQQCSFRDEPYVKTRLINEINPDFVYFCSFSPRNRLVKSILKGNPVLLIEHSELQSSITAEPLRKRIRFYLMELYSIIYAGGLICASKYLDEYYRKLSRKLFRRLPLLYSPYAFNKNILSSKGGIVNGLLKRYQGRSILLYMGTLARNYGLFSMLEAIKILSETKPELLLLLIGKGRHWEEAKQYVKINHMESFVSFLGYIPEDELSSYFGIAKYFISPLNNSIQDKARCPSKIYMYLPFGKPILTSAVGEPKEIFREDGFYFEAEDPHTLVALVQQLEDNPPDESTHDKVELHSWEQRAADFDHWITRFFKGEK